ncbi:MAG: phosphoglycerate mutase family protein [Alteraurantiacibacter sp.]
MVATYISGVTTVPYRSKIMGRTFGVILLAVFILEACVARPLTSAPEALIAERTIYITRHLQKLDGSDPSLSAEGAAAAQRLGDALANKGISAVFATATRRAMETAAPLAKRKGIEITVYDPRNPQALVDAAAASDAILVVGHSNTVHDLVARFGAHTPPAPLTEQDYGTVFVVRPTGEVDMFEIF